MFKFKRKKNENGEELENAYDVFMRNYKTVPGFKEIVKLFGYGLFIFILIIVAGSVNTGESTATTDKTTTTTTAGEKAKVYADIVNELRTVGTKVNVTVASNGSKYVLEGTVNESDFTGYIDTIEGTKKYKIVDNNIYELVLDQETMNNELFGPVDKDFIVPNNLVTLISSGSALIMHEEDGSTKYMYTISKNNVSYEINVLVKDEKCNKIEVKSEGIEYLITYNK